MFGRKKRQEALERLEYTDLWDNKAYRDDMSKLIEDQIKLYDDQINVLKKEFSQDFSMTESNHYEWTIETDLDEVKKLNKTQQKIEEQKAKKLKERLEKLVKETE